MVGSERQGWALLGVMAILFGLGVGGLYSSEAAGNPALAALQAGQTTGAQQPGGNMEGKEVRFGIAGSALFADVSTASSDGAVNSMHDSFLPLSGGILLANMMVDEVIVGAPGSGLFGMLLFCIVAVFLGGLMIGRTPEYVGKKIGSSEIKMTILALIWSSRRQHSVSPRSPCVVEPGLAGLGNAGPHGFSEILYAYTSAAATNGSAFAGLNAIRRSTISHWRSPCSWAASWSSSRFWRSRIACCTADRPALCRHPADRRPLYVFFLLGIIIIVGGLTYLPALALGPIVESLQVHKRHALLAGCIAVRCLDSRTRDTNLYRIPIRLRSQSSRFPTPTVTLPRYRRHFCPR